MRFRSVSPGSVSPGLVGYGCVQFGKSLLWAGEDILALYILVVVLRLPPALAGGLFLASALWNALCDGLFGAAQQRWPAVRRRLPEIALAALLLSCAAFVALPLLPPGHALPAALLLLLFRTGFSLADVPHNGLTGAYAAHSGHLGIARVRAVAAGSAALLVGLASFPILRAGAGAGDVAPLLVGALGACALLLMLPLPLLLNGYEPAATSGLQMGQGRDFRRLCLATLIGLGALAATGKALMHLEFTIAALGAAVVVLMTAGRLAAVWLWSPVARRLGNRPALALSYLLAGAQALLIPSLAASANAPALVALLTVSGIAGGGIALLSWAVLSETLGAELHARAPERYAAAFALFTMAMKIGLGLSALAVGSWLSADGGAVRLPPEAFWPLAWGALAASVVAAALVARRTIADQP
ncbi:hypothetical protein FJQ54_02405 [Sandaracinobacter neustonicus]|uniref:Na+/melibiose symporter-like transporter n=1 Tax=Sandaracinobacter neustonicus TaxID=1715348 RepID=A0A501XT69_9SPHN|nr:MFS transporter [Sandaracinobacter neustonicus]TPE63726.1 hypothetical protein FJQ54_02405 [Sandaracinobacter neustonicus]